METELINEHTRAGAAMFPGSTSVQGMNWQSACHTGWRTAAGERPSDAFDSFFYTVLYFTDFDSEWPIATDWKAVVRGFRGSLSATQSQFAEQLGFGRATVERWESGKTAPMRGNALALLDVVRPHILTPVQAGQLLNIAAAAVLPHLTHPSAEYSGHDVASLLRSDDCDHSDLAGPLIGALEDSRVFIEVETGSSELDSSYLTVAGRLRARSEMPEWAVGHLKNLERLSVSDRDMVVRLADRLAKGQ